MSWATNYERINNVYANSLPNMTDGRHFKHIAIDQETINEKNKRRTNIVTNNDYRKYLTKNAGSIIEKNSLYHYSKVGNPSLFQMESQNNTPYLYTGPLSNEKPIGYQDSDLKNHYLSREQLNIMRSPSIHVPETENTPK